MKFSLLFELRDISKEVIYFENIFFIFLGDGQYSSIFCCRINAV